MRKILAHPYHTMYNESEFIEYLRKIGFKIKVKKRYKTGIRYFIVVAQKNKA